MAKRTEHLLSNLNTLLDDICLFLSNKTNYETLSPQARKNADELLQRSKTHLQEIAKVAISKHENEYDGAYMRMERKLDEIEADGNSSDIYVMVEDNPVPPKIGAMQLPPVKSDEGPFSNLPARDISHTVKYGPLSFKTKVILKFEKFRKMFAVVHYDWLLIYANEKEIKPLQTFSLKYCRAQPVYCSKAKLPPLEFELMSNIDNRSYFFQAVNHKDMLQWTSHINKCNQDLNQTTLPIAKEEKEDNDEEDIYYEIEPFSAKKTSPNLVPPELPHRVPTGVKVAAAVSPPSVTIYTELEQEQSDEEQEDEANKENRQSMSDDSFSESNDEEEIYEQFYNTAPQESKAPPTPNKAPRESINVSPKPSIPSKAPGLSPSGGFRPAIPEKPALPEKPRWRRNQ